METKPLEPKEFIGGFEFEVRTQKNPDKWETIKIHPNCAQMLIDEVKQIFRQMPGMFRRVTSE